MIWSEFQESVRTLLTVDAQRKGAGIQSYIDSVILSGVIELQQYIPTLRSINRDTFAAGDMVPSRHVEIQGVQQGFTRGRGKITKAVILKPQGAEVVAIELNRWPWEKRNALAMNCLEDCRSPRFPGKIMECKRHINSFYVYPSISSDELLVLDWEGVKTSFELTDETAYDQRVVKVVSDYAKAHIVREVDKDLQLYKEYYDMYIKERSVLYLDEKDFSLFDMPAVSEDYYSTCCLKTEELNRIVAVPFEPSDLLALTTPQFAPIDLTFAGFMPSAPTGVQIANCRATLYHSCAISNSDAQIPIGPSDLQFFATNSDGTEIAPTNLQFTVGVATPPTDLSFAIKPFAPTAIQAFVANAPAAPQGLFFFGFVPTEPDNLDAFPQEPTRLMGWQVAEFPAAPTGLQILPIAPDGLTGLLSLDAAGTVVQPFDPPSELVAIHDGVGGTWVPEDPTGLVSEVEGQAPPAPTGLANRTDLYVIWRYEYIGGEFVKKEYYLVDIDAVNGGNTLVDF